MSVARNHKELICWQLCARLRSLTLQYIRRGPANDDYRFRGQMRAAARSACYQTSEGFYYFKHKMFAHYLDGAYASLGEVLDQIDDGHEQKYFTEAQQIEMIRWARRAMKCNRALALWLLTHPNPPESELPPPQQKPRRRRNPNEPKPPDPPSP